MAKKSKRKSKEREPLEYEIPFEPEEEVEQPRTYYKTTLAYLIDQDEVNELVKASTAAFVEPQPPNTSTDHPTYTEEECASLVDGTYMPRKVKKKSKV